ncbi:MAG: TIR domain-containing protein [Gammaproteobacteria bacterium]|nr:TIR domain-containing protein [Gammaproteobacteria bacterium]
MSTKQIHVFISHAWAHSDHYDTLSDWIFEQSWSAGQASLNFHNYSVPKDDPIHDADDDKQLKDALYNQISRSHVIVIPMGMYANYSKWIQKELDGAAEYEKPILAVNPWAQKRKSSVVGDASNKKVGWNSKSVVGGIWELYK